MYICVKCLQYKQILKLSVAKKDMYENVTVEIILEDNKNSVVTCIYRSPGSSLD